MILSAQRTAWSALAVCCLLAGCGDRTPDPVGRPLSKVDVSQASSGTGRKVDAATMDARRVAGTWRGSSAGRRIEATFGNDGSLSVQIMGDAGIVDGASGKWVLKDGILTGTLDGGMADLRRYARWSAAFADDGSMNVSGSDGAILNVSRK